MHRLLAVLPTIATQFEIILVEDGSRDQSWQKIEKICATHKAVTGLKLSRNFGQHNAIAAGLRVSKGDWVVVMDCDLQDDPQKFPRFMGRQRRI